VRVGGNFLGAVGSLVLLLLIWPAGARGQELKDLQAQFDKESNAVHKAKMLNKLGEVQFAEVRRAEKAGDNSTVGLTLEQYRDNVRTAFEALKKQHPNAEKQPNGYRHLEIELRKGIREVKESLIVAPEPYQPPLELVRQDLVAMDDELLALLFPLRPLNQKAAPQPPPEKQP
jgi:hypothetical protein